MFPFKAEYGITDNLSIGILFQSQRVSLSDVENDDGEKVTFSVKGGLVAPSVVYHFSPESKTDFYIGLAPGYTYSTWTLSSTITDTDVNLSGFYWKLDLDTRFYFGGKVSLNLNVAYNRAYKLERILKVS